MALTQVQIIQSLGEALAWFEKELAWGVDPVELRHLTGRIGELYAAMITRGQMAADNNQRGYDVISAENERISVKTVTSSNHVTFKGSTFNQVDRVMILRINVDDESGVSIEGIFEAPVSDAVARMTEIPGGWRFSLSPQHRQMKPVEHLLVDAEATYRDYVISQYENGTIKVQKSGLVTSPVKPHLREIAAEIGFPVQWESGEQKNTRQIGAGIIRMLKSRGADGRA